jgi:hypothetical protein
MDTREQNRVISINARPSSWPIARRLWLRATRGVRAATNLDPDDGIKAYAAQPKARIRGRRLVASGGARMTAHSSISGASIQYP